MGKRLGTDKSQETAMRVAREKRVLDEKPLPMEALREFHSSILLIDKSQLNIQLPSCQDVEEIQVQIRE